MALDLRADLSKAIAHFAGDAAFILVKLLLLFVYGGQDYIAIWLFVVDLDLCRLLVDFLKFLPRIFESLV